MTMPQKKAVALRYDPQEDSVPVLVAKGKGYLAERIIAIAQEHGIHVQQDPNLVDLLLGLEIEDAIPPQLYQVVARVLALIYRVNKDLARSRGIER
jgi:flagellar biosynthesis protein